MGTWTFTNFKDYAKFQCGQRTDLETGTNYYGVWVNAAYIDLTTRNKFWQLRIPKRFYFPELETSTTKTTTDGTAYVAMPTDALIIREVYDTTNNVHLEQIPWSKYIHKTDRTTSTAEGDPTQWVRQGSNIYLYRTPGTTGDTITIYYRKIPAVLTGTSATVIGIEWDEPILHLALNKGFMWLHEYDKAEIHKKEFIDMVTSLIDVYYEEEKARRDFIQLDTGYNQFEY